MNRMFSIGDGFLNRFMKVGACVLFMTAVTASASTIPSPVTPDHAGFVPVQDGRELYVNYFRAAPGKPTVILLNGLTYRVGSWNSFVGALYEQGMGLLTYDPMGQGQTLLRYSSEIDRYDYHVQATDLYSLLSVLGVNTPVHLVSLSYGGAIAMEFARLYPQSVASSVLMAPFVAPLASQDTLIRMQIAQTRLMFPYNNASFDDLYDYFLRIIVYSTYPSAEPIVLENPYKLEATFRLVQGVRKFLAKDILHSMPKHSMHLVVARQDQYIANSVHDEFWNQIPPTARASRLYIDFSEHKIPEAVPAFSAGWVRLIVNGDHRIQGGRTFVGNPFAGVYESADTRIESH